MEPYPAIKTGCNNDFIPKFTNGVRDGIYTVGEANLSDGIQLLVDNITADPLFAGLQIRRMQITPTGLYLITANGTLDPQYGFGNCLPDIDTPHVTPRTQGHTYKAFSARGITRF